MPGNLAGLVSNNGRVGILADDLTGAAHTALQFRGPESEVWVWPTKPPTSWTPDRVTTLAINTGSRRLAPRQAAASVDAACQSLVAAGCTRVFKQVDSALRGNLVPEVLQALSALRLELAVVAPAFPQAGRVTVGGYQLVESLPVEVSPVGRDPQSPVPVSHLPSLLIAGGAGDVAFVSLSDVMQGAERVALAIARAVSRRCKVLVADAARPEDLLAIARAIAMTPFRILPVGSTGLARALQPHHLLAGGDVPAPRHHLVGSRPPVLVVAGALQPHTDVQVAKLAPHQSGSGLALEGVAAKSHVTLDTESLLLGGSQAIARTTADARARLLGGQDVVLTAGGLAIAERAFKLARDLGMGRAQLAGHVADALGAVTAAITGEVVLSGLVVVGGETASAVCKALGAPPMRLVDEPLATLPLLHPERVASGGTLRLVLVSGSDEQPDMLPRLVDRLKATA